MNLSKFFSQTWVKLTAVFLLGVICTVAIGHAASDDDGIKLEFDQAMDRDEVAGYVNSDAGGEVPRALRATSSMKMSFVAEEGNAYDNVATDRKIIKSGSLQIEVPSTEEAVQEAKSIVDSMAGFIDSLSMSEWRQDQMRAYMNVRVPSEDFAAAMLAFKNLGKVQSENENTQDITDQYRENESQIENLRGREEQLRKFYDRAENVEEIMSVYNELENVRYQIESLERQQQRYDKQVTYSTISLDIVPEISIESLQDNTWSMEKAWKSAVNEVKSSLRGLADWGLTVVAYAVIWVPVVLVIAIIWWIIRRRRNKKSKK